MKPYCLNTPPMSVAKSMLSVPGCEGAVGPLLNRSNQLTEIEQNAFSRVIPNRLVKDARFTTKSIRVAPQFIECWL